ncbi:MAG: hypothetical protein R3B13_11990 [Polyangiaceae bacterium]
MTVEVPEVDAPRPSMVSLLPEPTVLLVADDSDDSAELFEALDARALYVERCRMDSLESVAVTIAPDLVVLAGTAMEDGGHAARVALETSELTAGVPIVLAGVADELQTKLHAARWNALPLAADDGADLAMTIEHLANEGAQTADPSELGATTLEDLVTVLSSEVRAGVLTARPADAAAGSASEVRLVLGQGIPIAKLIEEFVERLRPHVLSAEAIEYELHERASGSVLVVGRDSLPPPPAAEQALTNLRIVVADDDAARADAVAQALRARGAEVVVTTLDPAPPALARLRRLDPAVLVIGEEDVRGGAFQLVNALHGDMRARWSSWLVVRWDEIWSTDSDEVQLSAILGAVAALGDSERALVERIDGADSVTTRVEVVGPARLLRAVAQSTHAHRIVLENPRLRVVLEVGRGRLYSCEATTADATSDMRGLDALAAYLVVSSGKVLVERLAVAPTEDLDSPLADALAAVDAVEAPIQPSLRPPPNLGVVEAALSVPPAAREAEEEPDAAKLASAAEVEPASRAPSKRWVWVGIAAAVGLAGVVAFWIWGRGGEPSRSGDATAAASSRAGATGNTTTASPVGTGSAASSLIERARAGDTAALKALADKPPGARTVDEAMALAEGQIANERVDMQALVSEIVKAPSKLEDAKTVAQLRRFAKMGPLAPDALRAIAGLPGPRAADLLFAIWAGTPGRNTTTALAERLVNSAEVRDKASPELRVALDLRNTTDCEALRHVLEAAKHHGDQRSLRPLASFMRRTGCGKGKAQDCFACLRKDKLLTEAVQATRKRPAPRL